MTNPLRGEVACQIAGTDYTFCFTANGLCALEAETGKTVHEIGEALRKTPERVGFTIIRALVWAGLVELHPSVTIKMVGSLAPGDLLTAAAAAAQAFGLAFPAAATGGDARPQKAAGGSGKRSSSHTRKRG